MTDQQLTILVSVIVAFGATIGAAIRWAVGRITKAIDDSTAGHTRTAEASLESARISAGAQVELAKAMTALSIKIDDAKLKIDDVHDFVEHHTPVEGTELVDPRRIHTGRTPVGGVPIVERGRTRPGDRDR